MWALICAKFLASNWKSLSLNPKITGATPCSSSYWSGGTNNNGINQSNWSGTTGPSGTGATSDGTSHSAVSGTAVLPKYLRVVYLIRVI